MIVMVMIVGLKVGFSRKLMKMSVVMISVMVVLGMF